ncbi:MAG TPA: rhodanese-like domain-containing protein [Desulfurivibrionaceae bacterium]|nr:rhodanese-like domain-containing protein [Desulfurivibrionaceae bacterium]
MLIIQKIFLLLCLALFTLPSQAKATDYSYVSADNLKAWLESARPVLLVDIQEKKDFATHHIKGALETNAYPVESETERGRLLAALEQFKTGRFEAVVVVCPRGKGGAKRTYEFLRGQGVPEGKLFILTNGMENWPHQTWVESN